MSDNDTEPDATEHETVGEIDGHDVVVKVTGPESQDLDDDSAGSDVVMTLIENKLSEVKRSVESETEQ